MTSPNPLLESLAAVAGVAIGWAIIAVIYLAIWLTLVLVERWRDR